MTDSDSFLLLNSFIRFFSIGIAGSTLIGIICHICHMCHRLNIIIALQECNKCLTFSQQH